MCGLSVCPMFNQRLANQRKTALKGSVLSVCFRGLETQGRALDKARKRTFTLLSSKAVGEKSLPNSRLDHQLPRGLARCSFDEMSEAQGSLASESDWRRTCIALLMRADCNSLCVSTASVFYQFFVMFLNVILFDQWPIWSQFTGIFLSMYCTDFNSGHQTKGDDGHLRSPDHCSFRELFCYKWCSSDRIRSSFAIRKTGF